MAPSYLPSYVLNPSRFGEGGGSRGVISLGGLERLGGLGGTVRF